MSQATDAPDQVRGTGEYDYPACQKVWGKRRVYAPNNGQWFARDQAFAKGRPEMGQEPEERLDEDLEIDSETAENVTGGFFHLGASHLEDHNKKPEIIHE